MRTYGRLYDELGNATWVEVDTAPDGSNDLVWIVTLQQALKLSLNESPFYASYGIPAQQSVILQVSPDFNVALMQQLFSGYFASLIITKTAAPDPTYDVSIITNQGVKIRVQVPG